MASNVCVECESGKTAAAANDVTTCANAICVANQHVTTNLKGFAQCEQCAAGYSNGAGDNAHTRAKHGASQPCKVETNDHKVASGWSRLDNSSYLWRSDWTKPLWKNIEPWYTHCDGCAANYHVQANTHNCVTCASGKSSAPAPNRWLAATECQLVA